MNITTWDAPFNQGFAADLLLRLRQVRWSDAITDDWQQGTAPQPLRALVDYWLEQYDWSRAATRINALPHYRASVDGVDLHFLHFKGAGAARPALLLTNGWPSSFVEYTRLAPLLADFDVVMPSHPGYGYSSRPTAPGQAGSVALFHRLMTEGLNYTNYIVSGTDIGAGVATRMALAYPDAVRGLHIAAVVDPPLDDSAPPLTDQERAYQKQVQTWSADEGAYLHLQATRPQTVAYALNDSPVGLASWILEKFRYWSDAGPDLWDVFPLDMLLDNINIYWSTQTIGSSMRLYHESRHLRAPLVAGDRVVVPTAVCMWPRDLVTAPASWARRFYNLQRYTVQPRGGHFPAWEQPALYAADLRAFAAMLS
ncbi:epoxide hydrolase family protein [Massilia sp. S19_KUP03_FR1]|uniref:epoxide hydrolase family protein n=1 Tax=Massilia sp. S19_KUP03_FR1 TaxID=3025503 RepID=UPI002FCCD799